ncbi:hypothetical protein ABZ153_19005 [Streptomyces sp. NPDC006290]|uniref:hypothetical protein n=1 Tax=Streptomyces sp. NPDC006290 TaxID=3156745 RepID=UPI0033BA7D9D
MSTRPHPPLKSVTTTPNGPHAAPQPVDTTAVGEPKVVARQGVLSALPRSNRFPAGPGRGDGGDPTPERPGIRIYAPPVYRHHKDGARWSTRHGDTPSAAFACSCGEAVTAIGAADVAALVAEYAAHKHFCTGAPALTEGRAAA